MLHFYTFQCFRFAFFSSCNLCMLQFLPAALCFEQSAAGSIVAIFSILDACGGSGYASTIFMFYFFHVALFPCRIFSMLHFFHVALVPCSVFFMLHFFHVAFMLHCFLFPCCTLPMLDLFITEKYWKWTADRKHDQRAMLHLTLWTCFTFILICYQKNCVLPLYSFEWLIKWKETNFLFCWKRIRLPRLETFKTRTWIELYFSPT